MATARSALQGGAFSKWISGTSYGLDAIVWSPISSLNYRRIVAGAGTTDPSADGTNWAIHGPTRPKPTQRGVVSIAGGASTGTATITSVNTAKAKLRTNGMRTSAGTTLGSMTGATVVLTNATTVTATRTDASAHSIEFAFEIDEDW